MKKMLPILALVGFSLVSLTGCVSPEPSTPGDAPKANTENSEYTVEYVQVEENTIRCLWYNKDFRSGSMSCDWDNPVVE